MAIMLWTMDPDLKVPTCMNNLYSTHGTEHSMRKSSASILYALNHMSLQTFTTILFYSHLTFEERTWRARQVLKKGRKRKGSLKYISENTEENKKSRKFIICTGKLSNKSSMTRKIHQDKI